LRTIGGDAVVGGIHRDPDPLHGGVLVALPGRQLHCQLFQPAQRAVRLGQLLLPRQRSRAHARVRHRTGTMDPIACHTASPVRTIGKPATTSTTRSHCSVNAWCSRPACRQIEA
jgi:hypothetical protein